MKSSCKQGPVIISDSDSDDNLQPLQRKAICEALPEFVEEVAATEERHPVSLPGNQQDEFPLVSAGTSRRHSHATFVVAKEFLQTMQGCGFRGCPLKSAHAVGNYS